VLEVATGTGFWLPMATADCAQWLGTDLNSEVLSVAQEKGLDFGKVRFQLANAYALADTVAGSVFDAAFAGLWFSHVPVGRRAEWLAQLHACLQPGARVVLIDNRYVDGDSTPITRVDAEGNGYQLRSLSDGSQHEVMKNFPTAAEFEALLGGRSFEFRELDYFWTLSYTR
jgi:demethylmenaquinone methyltransferase/2-methoxy-6-polyprenyl-1,4-benzoquinol methylase